MNFKNYIFPILALVAMGSAAWSDPKKEILKQKEDLDQIHKEVEDSRKKLDALKSQESSIQKKVSEFDQRIESNKKVVGRLNDELKQLQNNIKQTESALDKTQEQFDLSTKRYLGNIRQFYFTAQPNLEIIPLDPNEEVAMERRIALLTAVTRYEAGSLAEASDYLAQTIDSREKLLGEKKKVSKLKQTKESSTAWERTKKEKEQKELDKLRRKKTQEADRLLTLEQAAREMEMILVRLEQARQAQGTRMNGEAPSFFANLKGQLRTPYSGKIVNSFGDSIDKVTKLKAFSPGIEIMGVPGDGVFAVAAGSIAYVGELRGYGNFVIIDHDGQYFTTYAGLEKPLVIVGELVAGGMKIGASNVEGLVRFELRKGREPLDPIQWISIDAF